MDCDTLPEEGTSGWYIWTWEFSEPGDFFLPLHTEHLVESCPVIAMFLSLPPGSRFPVAPGHDDVWTDEALLDV